MASNGSTGRPLSPHLQVYRFSLLMALSILHRATGIALYLGTLIVVWWLVAVASGPAALAFWQMVFLNPLGLLVLFGYTWALFHHMMGGIRHLVWDTGARLDVASAKSTAMFSTIAAFALTILVWIVAFMVR